MIFGFGTMDATTKLAGAVMAAGSIVVKSNVKKVSHQTGGLVGGLFVDEGSHVKAGEVMVHLDETVAQATAALTRDFYELQAQRARLEAERDGADAVTFPRDLQAAAGDPDIGRIFTGEANLFTLRRNARVGRKKQLNERIAQLRNETEGFDEQRHAKDSELSIVTIELVGVQNLYDRSLIQLTRLDGLK